MKKKIIKESKSSRGGHSNIAKLLRILPVGGLGKYHDAMLNIMVRIERELVESEKRGSLSLEKTEESLDHAISEFITPNDIESQKPLGCVLNNPSDARGEILASLIGNSFETDNNNSGDFNPGPGKKGRSYLIATALQKSILYAEKNIKKNNEIIVSEITRIYLGGIEQKVASKAGLSLESFKAIFRGKRKLEAMTGISVLNNGWFITLSDLKTFVNKIKSGNGPQEIFDKLKELGVIDNRGRFLFKDDPDLLQLLDKAEAKDEISNENFKNELRIFFSDIKKLPRYSNKLGYGKSIFYLRPLEDKISQEECRLLTRIIEKEPVKYVHLLGLTNKYEGKLAEIKALKEEYLLMVKLLKGPVSAEDLSDIPEKIRHFTQFSQDKLEAKLEQLESELKAKVADANITFSDFESRQLTVENIIDNYYKWDRYIGRTAGIGIQDRDFFLCVERLDGNPFTVVGLPNELIFKFFKHFGVETSKFNIIQSYWPDKMELRKIYVEDTWSLICRIEKEEKIKKYMADVESGIVHNISIGNYENVIKDNYKLIVCLQEMRKYWDILHLYTDFLKDTTELAAEEGIDVNKTLKIIDTINELAGMFNQIKQEMNDDDNIERLMNLNKLPNAWQIALNKLLSKLGNTIYDWNDNKAKYISLLDPAKLKDFEDLTSGDSICLTNDYVDYHRVSHSQYWDDSNKFKIEQGLLNFRSFIDVVDKKLSLEIKDLQEAISSVNKELSKLPQNSPLDFAQKQVRDTLEKSKIELEIEIKDLTNTVNNLYFQSFEAIALNNLESKISGVEQASGSVIDDRNALIKHLETVAGKNTPNILLTMGNNGNESIQVLWNALLLLKKGCNVTLAAKSEPMMHNDCNILELNFVIPYFNSILRERFPEMKCLDYYLREKKLQIIEVDDKKDLGEKISSASSTGNKFDIAFLIGELWYIDFVGADKLEEPPYNPFEDTVLFSIHAHKNRLKPLAIMNDNLFAVASRGDYIDENVTVGMSVYSMLLPRVDCLGAKPDDPPGWYNKKLEYQLYSGNSDISLVDFTKEYWDKIKTQLIKECRAQAGLPEVQINIDGPYEIEDGKQLMWRYFTPHKFVKAYVEKDRLIIDNFIEYDKSRIARDKGTGWPYIADKISGLIKSVYLGELFKNSSDSGNINLMTSEEKGKLDNLKLQKINVEQPLIIENSTEVVQVSIPLIGAIKDSVSEYTQDGRIFVRIALERETEMSSYEKEKISHSWPKTNDIVYEIVPALYNRESGMVDFSFFLPNDEHIEKVPISDILPDTQPVVILSTQLKHYRTKRLQILEIIGLSNGNDITLKEFTDEGWGFQLNRYDINGAVIDSGNEKMEIDRTQRKPLTVKDIITSKVVGAPIDLITTMEGRRFLNLVNSQPFVNYTELVREGGLFAVTHGYNPMYWEDSNYISGLPRMKLSSQDGPLVCQLAGPHNLPIEIHDLGLFSEENNYQNVANTFAKAALLAVRNGAAAIDINMGSTALIPQGGGVLIAEEKPDMAVAIVKGIKDALVKEGYDVPVCVKTRLLEKKEEGKIIYDHARSLAFYEKIIDAGAEWIAIHTRYRSDGQGSVSNQGAKDARSKRKHLKAAINEIRTVKEEHFHNLPVEVKNVIIGMLQQKDIIDGSGLLQRARFDEINKLADLALTTIDQEYWQEIYDILKKRRTPILGNGQVTSVKDALELVNDVGCDGVMIAMPMVSNPKLMGEIKGALNDNEQKGKRP
ncbi:MAG: hypothetical protein DKM50_02895 [Candidatus Margulisiibacteriota bacterium]|nr:MAG: hypothetical protein DKM50_02895 [Candidatus Margulisiibacteriota bacterium]